MLYAQCSSICLSLVVKKWNKIVRTNYCVTVRLTDGCIKRSWMKSNARKTMILLWLLPLAMCLCDTEQRSFGRPKLNGRIKWRSRMKKGTETRRGTTKIRKDNGYLATAATAATADKRCEWVWPHLSLMSYSCHSFWRCQSDYSIDGRFELSTWH